MSIKVWPATSLNRVFPRSTETLVGGIRLPVARGERASFQVCVRNEGEVEVRAAVDITGAEGLGVRIRRVGYVPVPHHSTHMGLDNLDGIGCIPGFVPDPLFPEQEVLMGPYETHAFWVTLTIPPDTRPGLRRVAATIKVGDDVYPVPDVAVDVRPVTLQPAHDFPVTHWFYADQLLLWYKLKAWEEKFWQILPDYMKDLVEHGTNCMYVPVFTPPTDGIKRASQLLRITTPSPGKYVFSFADVRRWVRIAKTCGARYFEWTHLLPQWDKSHAIPVYLDTNNQESLLWPSDTKAVSDTYRNFLQQFLPAFKEFLDEEQILQQSFFHVGDEPAKDVIQHYRAAREMIREIAPWYRTMDAMADIDYAREGLTDIPVPITSVATAFIDAGFPAWVYFCCWPRGRFVNRLMDSPLSVIRMTGWLFHKLQPKGFLHWGYNCWNHPWTQTTVDPYREGDVNMWPGWPYGDPFVVYPGPDGPVDSIRWEVFAESLQDMALLKTVGIPADDPMLAEVQRYDDFPRTPAWINAAREKLLGEA